ncbi:MAG: alpha/beta fold hydrolase [Acidobacteria bacterium]|nr:alpha/beta fold hydrolase [Acidobacteriota bacterium]
MWKAQLSGLSDAFRVVAVDLRGHGRSSDSGPRDYSMDLFADDLAATLDSIGVESAHVGALSMGGYVAFALWRRHPRRVNSLTLACTKAEADSPEGKEGRARAAALARERGTEALWAELESKMFGPSPSEEVRESVHRMFLRTPDEVAASDALAMRDRPDSTEDLPTISVPALWIAGAADQLMAPEAARAAAARIPGCRFVKIPGAGHLAPMEQPDAVNRAIREHLL